MERGYTKMARKKINTDELMKNFIPLVPETVEPQDENKHIENKKQQKEAASDSVIQKPKKREKTERTKPITFCMPESVNARMMKYIFTKKLAGEKITVTQMLNEAIIKYMDELGIPVE